MSRRNFDDIPVVSWLAIIPIFVLLLATTLVALMSAGALYGTGISLVNYGRSLRESIQPERPAP